MNWWTFWDTHDINDHDVPFLISFNCLCKNTLLLIWKVCYMHTRPTEGKKTPLEVFALLAKRETILNTKVEALLYGDSLGPRFLHRVWHGCEQVRDQTLSTPGRRNLSQSHHTAIVLPACQLPCECPTSAPSWLLRPVSATWEEEELLLLGSHAEQPRG